MREMCFKRVIVLLPAGRSGADEFNPGYDTAEYRGEMDVWFKPLMLDWQWLPVRLDEAAATIARLAHDLDRETVVFNLCDGDELDGFPGVSVVRELERFRIPFTGADRNFYHLSTYKSLMHEALVSHGVYSPPLVKILNPSKDVVIAATRIGFPCIVKLDIGANGLGLSAVGSVALNEEQLASRVEALWNDERRRERGVLVQKFLTGREFSILLTGSAHRSAHIKIYPPLEKVFGDQIALEQRIMYEDCRHDAQHSDYGFIDDDDLIEVLCETARQAFLALDGRGYARIDMRLDPDTNRPGILEVNANCGLSSVEPTIALPLSAAGTSFDSFISEILADCYARTTRSAS